MQSAGGMGGVLPELATNPSAAVARPADFIPLRLVVKPGDMAMELDRVDVLVGRHSRADVRLALPDVSRRHCRLVFSNGGWQVVDLNSLNGVFVNGERVIQAALQDHDIIGIGAFRFEVEMGNQHSGAEAVAGHKPEVPPRALSVAHLAMQFEGQRKAS